jgi:alkylation response protein AidB-like acyl-CoA dehydrogenase
VDNWRLAKAPNIQGASQLIQAAIDAGIAAAIDDAIAFVRERAAVDRSQGRARQRRPYVIADIGKLKIELHAAEALLRKAGQVDEVAPAPSTRRRPAPRSPWPRPRC